MATGFGLPIDAQGNGTTPEDLQLIIGANWRVDGILSGCAVDRTSKMAYRVHPGAVVLSTGDQRRVVVPVIGGEVPVDPNPGSQKRRDKVYVQQRISSADGDNLAVLAVTQGSLPARSVLLEDFEVPAGASNTQGAVSVVNRVYTRSVGGQYGVVAKSTDTDTTVHGAGVLRRGEQYLSFAAQWNGVAPGDRDLIVHFTSSASTAAGKGGVPVDERGTVCYKFYLNNELVHRFEREINSYRTQVTTSFPVVIQRPPSGQGHRHRIHYTVELKARTASGKWQVNYGGSEGFPGDQLWVVDNGAATL